MKKIILGAVAAAIVAVPIAAVASAASAAGWAEASYAGFPQSGHNFPVSADSASAVPSSLGSGPPMPVGVASGDVVSRGDADNDVLTGVTGRRALRTTQATSWNGGAFVTSSGQRLTIHVHKWYAYDQAAVQRFAEWLAPWLYHSSELSRATFYLIPPSEMATFCGTEAYGCYEPSSASLYVPWSNHPDGMHFATTLAHEYGHHVAWSRANPPWQAGVFGPKRWASQAQVCKRVANGTAHPDGRGGLYWSDPAEIFAETYALAVNRNGNWLENWWPVWSWNYDPSFNHNVLETQAAADDATSPYEAATTDESTGKLKRKNVRVRRNGKWRLEPRGPVLPAWHMLPTELDGQFHAALGISPNATLTVIDSDTGAILAPSGRSVSFTICGQRNIDVRVSSSRPGPYSLTITHP